jgi:hypothetical protein
VAVDAVPVEGHLAFGDLALVDVEEAGDGPEQRGLARPVGAQQGDDLAFGHVEGHTPEHEDDVVVHDLEVADGEHQTRHLGTRQPAGG